MSNWLDKYFSSVVRHLGVNLPMRGVVELVGNGVVATDEKLEDGTQVTRLTFNADYVELPNVLGNRDMLFYDEPTESVKRIPAPSVAGTYALKMTVGADPAWVLDVTGPTFDPASLNPTGRWKTNYAGAPWAGLVGGNLIESTNPPSVGISVSGKTPADFNGGGLTNDMLTSVATFEDLFGLADFGGILLANVDSISTDDTTPSYNETLVCTTGSARFQIVLRSNGTVRMTLYDASAAEPECFATGMTTGTIHAIHWRHTGTHIQVGIDGAWGAPVAAGLPHASNGPFTLTVGRNVPENQFLDGQLFELMTFDATLSDDDVNDLIAGYLNPEYGQSL